MFQIRVWATYTKPKKEFPCLLATMWCLLAVAMSGEISDQLFHHYYCRLVSLEPKHTLQLGFEFNPFTDASGAEMVQTGTRKVVG